MNILITSRHQIDRIKSKRLYTLLLTGYFHVIKQQIFFFHLLICIGLIFYNKYVLFPQLAKLLAII